MSYFRYSVLVFLVFWTSLAYAQIIIAVAGNDTAGYNGDSGPAIAARLFGPGGVALDGSGNLFISDSHNNRIRCVNTAGIITTVAGTGYGSYSGDGGAATAATLNNPSGIASDANGDLYVADYNNNCIRKITSGGIISTFAGNDSAGYRGDGGPATAAWIFGPTSVAVDKSGNVYIADNLNSRVRKVDTSGIITTIAGNGLTSFSGDGGPAVSAELDARGVTTDNEGNIYIADYNSARIRKINTDGIIHTIAGNGSLGYTGDGGQATAAELYYPTGVAVDKYGNVFIADLGENCVRSINNEGIISTIAGNGTVGNSGNGGPATAAKLNSPIAVLADNADNIYIADILADVVREISAFNNQTASFSKMYSHLIKIWPQPSTGVFNMSVSSLLNEPVEIILTGIKGQEVMKITGVTNTVKIINAGVVPPGCYNVTTQAKEWSCTEQVTIW